MVANALTGLACFTPDRIDPSPASRMTLGISAPLPSGEGRSVSDHRVHLFGASGSGTTTLGRALAAALDIPPLDTDDYWQPTDPPDTVKHEPAERVGRIEREVGDLLADRECPRYRERIDPGGDMHEQSKQFLAWAGVAS